MVKQATENAPVNSQHQDHAEGGSEKKDKSVNLNIFTKAYINGEFVTGVEKQTMHVYSPSNGQFLGDLACCDDKDVDIAVKGARERFESGVWSALSPSERKKRLIHLADLVEKHRLELGMMETMNMGKPLSESVDSDMVGVRDCFKWYAELIDKRYDEVTPDNGSLLSLVTREPIGVIAIVLPWNFPLEMLAWKVAPALAAGNSVIIKPAEQASLTALRWASLTREANIPAGVVQVLPGYGKIAGRALGLHPDVDMVAFTGSTEVGKLFLEYSAKSNMKQVSLECGGKSPVIVFEDVTDLPKIAKQIVRGFCYNQGEVCSAFTRLIVHKTVKKKLIELILEEVKKWAPANPFDAKTKMGAIVDQEQLSKIIGFVERAKKSKAKLLTGGSQVLQETKGFYFPPTIFDQVSPSDEIFQEEVFGPVLTITEFDEEAQAIELANDSKYGLAASFWTKDYHRILNVSKKLKAGTVCVNGRSHAYLTTPFGGYKQSGIGRDLSHHALDKYTQVKSTLIF